MFIMNKALVPVAFLLLLAACSSSESLPVPGSRPEEAEASLWLSRIIRYHAPLPDKADHITKWATAFDDYYSGQARQHRVDRWYPDSLKGDVFLLVSRRAPSLHDKRVSTGIHLRWEQDSLVLYKEVFRTWRLPEEVLLPRADSLFALMVSGADLSPYHTDKRGDQYIEFPDAHTRYDEIARRWVSDLEDPAGALKEEFNRVWKSSSGDANGQTGYEDREE